MLLLTFLSVAAAVIQPRQLRGSDVDYKAAAISPDETLVPAGGDNGRVLIWNSKTGSLLHALPINAKVQSLAFAGEGRVLIVGTAEQGMQIWRREAGQWALKKQVGEDRGVNCVALSSKEELAAFGSGSGRIYLYNSESWQEIGELWESSNLTSGLAFRPDGGSLVSAGNTFTLWDVRPNSRVRVVLAQPTVQELGKLMARARRWTSGGMGGVNVDPYCADVAVSPDGKRVVGVTGVGRLWSGGRTIQSWEASTGRPIWTANASGLTCVTYVADGTLVVTGSDDGTLRVWKATDGGLQREWKGHSKAVRSVVARTTGPNFVSAAEDGCVQMSDAKTGQCLIRYATE